MQTKAEFYAQRKLDKKPMVLDDKVKKAANNNMPPSLKNIKRGRKP